MSAPQIYGHIVTKKTRRGGELVVVMRRGEPGLERSEPDEGGPVATTMPFDEAFEVAVRVGGSVCILPLISGAVHRAATTAMQNAISHLGSLSQGESAPRQVIAAVRELRAFLDGAT